MMWIFFALLAGWLSGFYVGMCRMHRINLRALSKILAGGDQ